MLLQNTALQAQMPVRHRFNGAVGMMRTSFGRTDRLNQSQSLGALSSMPSASYPPAAWVLPVQAGSISSRNAIAGSGAIAPFALTQGRNLGASISGAGDMSGVAQLIISLGATLSGSGALVSPELRAYLQLAANLAGAGDAEGTASALANAAATLEGEASVDAAIRASGSLAAAIKVTGDLLDSSNVGAAVWSAAASANNAAGSMGEKLNDAGSASNPWTEVIESGYTAAEILRLIAGLGAAKASGGGTTEIHIRDLADTKDRAVLTVDENGNRTAVSLDLA